MAITFDGTPIKCGDQHTYLDIQGGVLQAQRTYFWGLEGVSEIVASPSEWQVTARCWLNDTTFEGASGLVAFRNYLKTLAGLRGTHGTLSATNPSGGTMIEFDGATFEGFNPTPFDGHREVGPIEDVTGMVSSGNGWILQGILSWTVLDYGD